MTDSGLHKKDANMSATDNARRALEEYGRAEYKRGYNDGYARALQTLIASAQEWLAEHEAKPAPAVEANGAADAAAFDLPPYLTRAMEYLKTHPGATASEASASIRNLAAFYALHKKGLVRKEGPKFYPI